MTNDYKIREEKQQYDINKEAAKISVLSSRKIDKYEYLAGEEILSLDQSRMIENYLKIKEGSLKYLGKYWENQKKAKRV